MEYDVEQDGKPYEQMLEFTGGTHTVTAIVEEGKRVQSSGWARGALSRALRAPTIIWLATAPRPGLLACDDLRPRPLCSGQRL